VLLGNFIPESAQFLLAGGRRREAAEVMRRFGAVAAEIVPPPGGAATEPASVMAIWGTTAALSMAAVTWGLVNFGLLLWLPADLVTKGYSVALSSGILAQSALFAFPMAFGAAYIYSVWSTKWSLVTMLGLTVLGLCGVMWLEISGRGNPVIPIAFLIIGSNGLLAVLLPYATESFPLAVRARGTGWIAACTKGGGLIAQALSITALVPSMATVAALTAIPAALAILLVAWLGRETRDIDLRSLDTPRDLAVR